MRVDRRRKLRDAVDGAVRAFENIPDARLLDDNFHQAYTLMSSAEGARGVRPAQASRRRSARSMA